ncbi:hypothetical protein FACS1894111_09750 [Clostridia bacterium]|nr:hypothetical protein FACS1894111_09750 [Clostridia bacterium]
MVESKINIEILQSLETYIRKISLYYRIDSVVLFGSYAQGTNHQDSDIDVAVISKDITDTIDDGAKLMSLTWGIDTRIEPHAINTEDFNIGDTPFIDEIIKTGVELYAA